MIYQIIAVVILSILGGFLYRMGGARGYNTKFRDLGVPLCVVLAMFVLGQIHWTAVLCFGLLFGALTTYWKKKGAKAKWWNWMLTGLGYSLAMLPDAIHSHAWLGFFIRTVLLTTGTVIWSVAISHPVVEEIGRGVLIVITIPLLLIGRKKKG